MNWIISANSKMYDHSSSFEHYRSIDWRQGNAKFEVGDTVYIYCTRPLMTFHKNVLKTDYKKFVKYNNGQEPTDLFYEALAWRGLKEHNVEAYKDLTPKK